jgi:hypothetical protein
MLHNPTGLDHDILTVLHQHPDGIICEHVEDQLGRKHQAVSGNMTHLIERGYIQASSSFGRTRSNRKAIKWLLTAHGHLALTGKLPPVTPPIEPTKQETTMPFKLEVTADTWAELFSSLPNTTTPPADIIATMDFQELAARFGERAEAEGYDFELISAKDRPLSAAEARKAAARAALRGELEGSLKEAEAEKPEADPTVEPAKPAKKGKANGKTETPEEMKARCITALHDLYSSGKKDVVGKILAEHGGGVKNFGAIPPENFTPISEALRALQH